MKDFITVRECKGKVQHQKRLLLLNLKQLYLQFKLNHKGIDIGFSKFCSLRPRWCLTVFVSGMHSVCICQIHQNLKFLVSIRLNKAEYKDIMSIFVCNMDSRDCMIHHCEGCPGNEKLVEYLFAV